MLICTFVDPRYPEISVRLRTAHPLALIGAVRHALRRAGVERPEIERFSNEALRCGTAERQRQVCRRWVRVDAPEAAPERRPVEGAQATPAH